MSNTKTTPKKRSVSKARLYKELEATIEAKNIGLDAPVGTLMESIKDDIVTEALSK